MNQIRLILMCLLGFLFLGPGSAATYPSPHDEKPAVVVGDGSITSMSAPDSAGQIVASLRRSTMTAGVDDRDLATCGAKEFSVLADVTAGARATSDPLRRTHANRSCHVIAKDAAADAQLASPQR